MFMKRKNKNRPHRVYLWSSNDSFVSYILSQASEVWPKHSLPPSANKLWLNKVILLNHFLNDYKYFSSYKCFCKKMLVMIRQFICSCCFPLMHAVEFKNFIKVRILCCHRDIGTLWIQSILVYAWSIPRILSENNIHFSVYWNSLEIHFSKLK